MADEKNMMPELTLTPDTTAAAEEVPTLTLEPSAPATPAAPAPEKPAAEPVKLDDSMLSEAEKKAVEEFSRKIDIMDSNMILQYGAAAQTWPAFPRASCPPSAPRTWARWASPSPSWWWS